MVPLGTKALFALAAVTMVAAIAYGVATNDGSGGAALSFVAVGAAILAVVVLYADPDRSPAVAPDTPLAEQAPAGERPPAPSAWPLAAAVALAVLTIAAAADAVVLGTAFVLLALVGLAWAFQHWTEDETYTPAFGQRVRERFFLPIGLPLGVAFLVATIAISLSRVFLALPENGTRAVALAIAVVVLVSAVAIAASERMARTALALLSAFALICVVAAGGVGLAHGERKFEKTTVQRTAIPAPGEAPAGGVTTTSTTTP